MRNRQEMLHTLSKLTALREKPSNPAALPPNFPDKTSRKAWRHFSSSLLPCNSWTRDAPFSQAIIWLRRSFSYKEMSLSYHKRRKSYWATVNQSSMCSLGTAEGTKRSTGSSARAQNSVRNWVVRPRALRQLPCSDATSCRHIATLDLQLWVLPSVS